MQTMYYIGLDVHKRTISYCVKDGGGTIHVGIREKTVAIAARSRTREKSRACLTLCHFCHFRHKPQSVNIAAPLTPRTLLFEGRAAQSE